MRAHKNRLGTFGAGGFWWWNQHFRIDFYRFLICFMAAKCFLCQERQRLEAMPELMILLILQWHVERHVTKLRLEGEMRLLLLEKFEHLKMIDGFRVFIRFYTYNFRLFQADCHWEIISGWTARLDYFRYFRWYDVWCHIKKHRCKYGGAFVNFWW